MVEAARNIIPYGSIPIDPNREERLAADYMSQLALQVISRHPSKITHTPNHVC